MPIYEYQCAACGHQFDKLQKMSDSALIECPECGKPQLQKLVSAAGFHLKGTGWYVTDFRDNGKKPAESKGNSTTKTEPLAESKSEAKSEAKSETKSETKSEPKAESKSDSSSAAKSE